MPRLVAAASTRRWSASIALRVVAIAGALVPTGCGGAAAPPAGAAAGASPTTAAPEAPLTDAQRREAGQRQCNALIDPLNATIEGMQEPGKVMSDAARTADLERIAALLEAGAAKMSRVQLTDAELVRLRGHYLQMVRSMTAAARRLIGAARTQDIAAVEAAQQDIEAAIGLEDGIVDELNEYCQAF